MSGLLPSDTESARRGADDGGDLRVLWLDDEESDRLISSLSSETARSILASLHERPATASELSEEVDTSLQNIRHHVSNLQDAELVKVAETRYSVKGREMNVYAPADDSLVVCVGREDDRSTFLDSLKRFLGAAALLALGSLLVELAYGPTVGDAGGPGTSPRIPDAVGGAGAEPLLGLVPPGAAFLAGGLLVLAVLVAWEFARR